MVVCFFFMFGSLMSWLSCCNVLEFYDYTAMSVGVVKVTRSLFVYFFGCLPFLIFIFAPPVLFIWFSYIYKWLSKPHTFVGMFTLTHVFSIASVRNFSFDAGWEPVPQPPCIRLRLRWRHLPSVHLRSIYQHQARDGAVNSEDGEGPPWRWCERSIH